MAKIWYLGDEIIRYIRNDEEEKLSGGSPDIFDGVIEFDIATNNHIDTQLNDDWNNHKIINGELYYNGIVVNINDFSRIYIEYEQAKELYNTANNEIDWLDEQILLWDTLDNTQKQIWLSANLPRILKENRELIKTIKFIGKLIFV